MNDHSAVIDLSPKLAGLALPSRRFPGPAPRADGALCWDLFVQRARQHIRVEGTKGDLGYLSAIADAQQRLASGSGAGSLLSDAVLLAIETGYERYVNPADGAPFLDHLVATRGLPYACDVFIMMQANIAFEPSYRSTHSSLTFVGDTGRPLAQPCAYEFSHTELALRAHLAHADQATWQQCADQLQAALPRLSVRRQPLLCVLLPELPALSDALAEQQGGSNAPNAISWLLLTATSASAIAKLRQNRPTNPYNTLGFYNCPQALATLIAERGVDAVPLLADGAIIPEAAWALASIGTPPAMTALAKASGMNKDSQIRFADATRRWPLATIAALAELIPTSASKFLSVDGILRAQVSANLEAMPDLIATLSPLAAALVGKLVDEFNAPLELAQATDLPRVLSSPPWNGSPKKAAAAIKLEALQLAPIERWAEGEREAIVNDREKHGGQDIAISQDPHELADALTYHNFSKVKALAAAIAARDIAALNAIMLEFLSSNPYLSLRGVPLVHLPASMGASAWNELSGFKFYDGEYVIAKLGLEVVAGIAKRIESSPVHSIDLALPFGSVALAVPIARAYTQLKKVRASARAWLLAYPEHAIYGLIAPALGKAGTARTCAAAALRMLAGAGHDALLIQVAERYQMPNVVPALRAMLDEDPLDLHPAKVGPLPAFWAAHSWSRPLLASNGKALPDSALDYIGQMMRFPSANGPYAGLLDVKQACTSDSLAAFGWDAFNAWLDCGSPPKESWVMTALGYIGNDEIAHRLVPMLRAWPTEGQSARAINGLDTLANIGSDTAIMLLHAVGQKAKSRPLQDAARLKIEQVAEARELSADELADRTTPDFGLDAQGTAPLDFGPRSFRVGFDEALKPYVLDQDGARLADLPKPKQSDDQELAELATTRFKRLKKDVRAIATQLLQRLETAMCHQRRWAPQTFRTFLVEHPLVGPLVQRLVWGAYDAQSGQLLTPFRVSQEREWTGAEDDAVVLPDDDAIRIGIVHALELDSATAAAFGQLFADYKLLQPFSQIGRDTHVLSEQEAGSTSLQRWASVGVPSKNVLGLASRGWRRGPPLSHGMVCSYTKELGEGQVLEITLDPGIYAGAPDEYPEQKVVEIRTGPANRSGDVARAMPLSSLHAVAASELIRDMEKLRA